MTALAVSAILLAMTAYFRARSRFRETSLMSAHAWGALAIAMWGGTFFCERFSDNISRPIIEQLWYAAALLTLTPMVAVLGARRPGVGAWNWFVIVPMLAIFELHAVTNWSLHGRNDALTLPTPMFIGVCVVLVMGTGNYLLTRYSIATLLTAASVLLVLLPLTSLVTWENGVDRTVRTIATLLLSAAILLATWQSRVRSMDVNPLNRVWFDYWDTFGLVWATRLAERLNTRAEAEQWPCRVGPNGFTAVNDAPGDVPPTDFAPCGTAPEIIQGVKWTMQRFVSERWIDERVSPSM